MIYMLPLIVHWRIERDVIEKAPVLQAAYRNTTLVPPHVLFPALDRHIDDKAKRVFLGQIVDSFYMSSFYLN